jgi:hypothetical protein
VDLDEHARHLGGLLGNLQSLEFSLRLFLNRMPGARPIGLSLGIDLYAASVGTEVPESDLTSYDTLRMLVTKFNAEMKRRGKAGLDPFFVELRDALAHGRVSAAVPDDHLRLLKFDKPINGKVRVTFNEVMTEDWFKAGKRRIYDSIRDVHAQLEP